MNLEGNKYPTVMTFDLGELTELPQGFDNEIRFTESFAKYFIEQFTDEGDKVIDIFAGFGTTLEAAEKTNRKAYGIEYEKEKAEHIKSQASNSDRVLQGSAFKIEDFELPNFQLCITSPPYMAKQMEVNPFENYSGESSYKDYLDDLENIFSNLESRIKEGGHLVVEVSNMKVEGEITPLAWDIADKISSHYKFKGEVVISKKKNGEAYRTYGFDHSYALIFEKT